MIIGHKINTSMFFFDKESGNFSQEISSLGNCAASLTARLYDDECDQGFVMVSARSGSEVQFYLSTTSVSDEGEILSWNFKSAVTADRPHLQKLTVTVFND